MTKRHPDEIANSIREAQQQGVQFEPGTIPTPPALDDPQAIARDDTSPTVRFAVLAYDVANKLYWAMDEPSGGFLASLPDQSSLGFFAGPSAAEVRRQYATPLENAYADAMHQTPQPLQRKIDFKIEAATERLNEAVQELFKATKSRSDACPTAEWWAVLQTSRELLSLCRSAPKGAVPIDDAIRGDIVLAAVPPPQEKPEAKASEVPESVYRNWPSQNQTARNLDCSPNTVGRWVREGRVRSIECGREQKIDPQAAEKAYREDYPDT